jgi:hypothetical protein
MPSTRQTGKLRRRAEEDSPPLDNVNEHEERVPQSSGERDKKRARTTKTTAKDEVAGKHLKGTILSNFSGMPLDVLYEVRESLCFPFSLMRGSSQIFPLLHPRDLLHISWTAKVFNEFLTTKSSRRVWQASFKRIPEREQPPPCPSGITEMAYANLVYGRHCTVCASASYVPPTRLTYYCRTAPKNARPSQPGLPW